MCKKTAVITAVFLVEIFVLWEPLKIAIFRDPYIKSKITGATKIRKRYKIELVLRHLLQVNFSAYARNGD